MIWGRFVGTLLEFVLHDLGDCGMKLRWVQLNMWGVYVIAFIQLITHIIS